MRRRSPLLRLLMILLVSAATVLVLYQFRSRSLPHPSPASLTVSFLESGQGDSTLIQTSSGKNILIDPGLDSSSGTLIGDLMISGVHHLDLLIVTDSTQDHTRSVTAIIRRIPTGSVMDNWLDTHDPAQIKLRQAIGRQTLTGQWLPIAHLVGSRIPIGGGAVIQYLAPLTRFTTVRAADSTIIMRISMGQVSVLLTGNASSREIGTLLARGVDIRATVLKVASHGAETNTSLSLLDRVIPKEMITFHDPRNNSLPKPIDPVLLEQRRIKVWHTDRQGTIQLRTNGTSYQLIPSRK